MSKELAWERLLSKKRQRESSTKDSDRSDFDKDYDRIISSSSVRRLQDKTQVFPLQENDVVRTRLTHSLEVSAIARSFGILIGTKLLEKGLSDLKDIKYELSSLLAVVGLVHDLGNPPFGHYGENIIREWFKEWFDKIEKSRNEEEKAFINQLSLQEKQDFLLFEGNAQTIRIVSRLQFLNDQYGINFTYGTLAALVKYPWDSVYASSNGKTKFGYYVSEKNLMDKIYAETDTGEQCVKNPLALILEAADDITYLLDDIEDGVKKKLISWTIEYGNLKEKHKEFKEIFDSVDEKCPNKGIPDYDCICVHNFKVAVQGKLIQEAVDVFFNNYACIMTGSFEGDLVENGKYVELKKSIQSITQKRCFCCEEVLKLELAGESVIRGLLDMFVPAIAFSKDKPSPKSHAGKLYSLISSNFKYVARFDRNGHPSREFKYLSTYEKIQLVTDYISGMTDSFAINLYEELAGIKISKG